MIYRLIKLENSLWKFSLVFAAICLIALYRFSLTGPLGVMIFCAALFLLTGTRLARRCTLFEAALPIHGRDLFCAKLLSNLGSIWLVLLTVIAAIPASHGTTAKAATTVYAFEAGSIMILGAIAIQSIHVQEFSAPRWWQRVIVAAVATTILIASFQLDAVSVPINLTICVLTICALGSAALFWRTWASIPESFQFAPREPVLPKSQCRTIWLPSFPWLPVLRTAYPAVAIGYFCPLFLCGGGGMSLLGIMIVLISILNTSSRVIRTGGWLFSLPISRQRIFLMIVVAPLGSFALGSILNFHLSSQAARRTFVDLMAVASTSLLCVAAVEILWFARRLQAARVYLALAPSVTLIYFVWKGFSSVTGANGAKSTAMEVWLGEILPGRMPLLIVTAVAVVGALYWLAYKGFCQAEAIRQRTKMDLT